ncbi:neuroglobin-like [Brachionus plicatilis]|uniref:Neuroglobin-like n=1 Tax=Brachionus plicatilis TaxID=10195 RepID=A0A3M7R6Y3_BRAPC|nr:neuroglobin-like [Brachionus plicatilis]
MGQKNSRVDNSAFAPETAATKENEVNNFSVNLDFPLKESNDIQPDYHKKFSLRKNDNKIVEVLKKNASETFSGKSTYPRSKSSAYPENRLNESQVPAKKSFVNNFYLFLNKNNSYWNNMNQNISVSYYMPDHRIESNGSSQIVKRSKSIPEITESAVSKLDIYQKDEFSELEINTIKLAYKFIKDDLNSVGVIAFMKSFETLPDIKDKFDAFKFLPIDELSKSHALRTHSKKVMNIIDQFVDALETGQLDQMKNKLFHLGERHHIYRAKKEYFSIIEFQFINAIRPILTKNLQIIQKNQLIEINEEFAVAFDDRFLNSSEDDLYIDTYLNNDEVFRAFELIKLMWHKIFEVIRFYMDMGMDSFESKIKQS